MIGRRGRKRKQILDGLEEMRGCWKLKEEALDHTLELAWEEAVGLSQDGLQNELTRKTTVKCLPSWYFSETTFRNCICFCYRL